MKYLFVIMIALWGTAARAHPGHDGCPTQNPDKRECEKRGF